MKFTNGCVYYLLTKEGQCKTGRNRKVRQGKENLLSKLMKVGVLNKLFCMLYYRKKVFQ